jgi:hypothetical protein
MKKPITTLFNHFPNRNLENDWGTVRIKHSRKLLSNCNTRPAGLLLIDI